ncbi:MAG TPA: TRAP transporter large permease [Candidatus Scalindua sp.]|nr:TRAP transporter large permease [Candidatus Scalindua sp.]
MTITFIILFSILLIMGVPVFMTMLASSYIFFLFTQPSNIIAIPHKMFNGIDSFVLLSLPFFLFVGQLMSASGILDRLLKLSKYLVGRMAGGLSQVNILVSMLFAGISGTATADTAAIGSMLIPSMIKEKYSAAFSAAVTAASSTIGPVIPPSVIMIAMGALVGISIGRLFLGGIIPGFLVGLFMLLVSYIISKRRKYGKIQMQWSLKLLIKSFINALGALLVPLIVVGGIVTGVFTPTEASNIVVILILILGFLVYRELTFRGFWNAVKGTLYLLGPVMLVISAASVFGNILIRQHAGEIVANTVLALSSNPKVILLLIALVSLVMGCFIEALAIMILMAPVIMPFIQLVNIDPVHFGVVMVQALMIGLITPPVGISMFMTCSIANISIEQFAKEVLPFFLILILVLLISIFFPQTILFIPNLIMTPR